jgi:arylsulfatase A-like enzyme
MSQNLRPHSRRCFLRNLGLAVSAIGLSQGFPAAFASTGAARPNVLLILADDLNFDSIGALGNPYIQTPNIDFLIGRGVTFTNAHIMGSTKPAVCMPSRAMLLTGKHIFHLKDKGRNIPEDHITLPEHLTTSGFETFATGKWHNHRSSLARGFQRADKVFFGGMSDHFKIPVHDFDPSGKYNPNQSYILPRHSSEIFTEAVREFFDLRRGRRPFFVYLPFTAPHDPRQSPAEFKELYSPEDVPLPESFLPRHPFDNGEMNIRDEQLAPWPRTPEAVRRHIAGYYSIITHLDAQIGLLLDRLGADNLLDNTIIVFASDNGLALGRHGLMGKQNLYQHSVRVPLSISGPDIPRGETRDQLCYLHDVFPTLCDLIGVDIPQSVESTSLAPIISNPDAPGRENLYFAYMDVQRAVRGNRWKLIEYHVGGQTTLQLFDLANDPLELRDRSGQRDLMPLVERMQGLLRTTGEAYNDHITGYWSHGGSKEFN